MPTDPGSLSRSRAGLPLVAIVLVCATFASCRKNAGGPSEASGGRKNDALFLAEAPAMVPEELEPDFDAMGIGRLYVAGASLSASGEIKAFPPPPSPIKRPVVFVVMGEVGAEEQLRGPKGDLLGETWASALSKPLQDAKAWAKVVGIHLHVIPPAASAPVLAGAIKAMKRSLGLPVSFTVTAEAPPEAWKPLKGVADEALVFSLGRRPETADRMVPEFTDAMAKAFPIPFRLLLVPGGYGFPGSGDASAGRRIPDGEIDKLSEDKGLDFDFGGQVLSNEAGNLYSFKARSGVSPRRTLLGGVGGNARFQVLALSDMVKLLSGAGRWGDTKLKGRVFLVDGLPSDGHLLGFPAIKALLTGRPLDPKLDIKITLRKPGAGYSEFSIRVANLAPSQTELSHYDNWIQVRTEGAVFSSVAEGDFERFELLSSDEDRAPPAPFGRATVCRLYESFFAPEEINESGPIRIAGSRPHAYVSYRIALPDGRILNGGDAEIPLTAPAPEVRAPVRGQEPEVPQLGRQTPTPKPRR